MGFIFKKSTASGFTVPEIIVDEYLRFASGDQIKVLLSVLRFPGIEVQAVSKYTKLNESEVSECLRFWELMGVIERGDTKGVDDAPKEEPEKFIPGRVADKPEVKNLPPVQSFTEYTRPSPAEIAARMEESAEIRGLFRELQTKLGKTIGYDGQCTFLRLFDNYGLPPEVIYMLVDWCVNNGKSGYSYIEKAGRSWAEQEIDTFEKACEKVSQLDKVSVFWNRFAAAQGLKNAKPTASQTKYIETWLGEYKSDFDMICLAYEQTVERTGKLSFAYMDKILANWHGSGFKSVSDVEKAEKTRKDAAAKPVGKSGASYDIGKAMEDALKKTPRYERGAKK